MLTSIEGRSVIVTGASKGIGKGIARVFAGRGARVLIAARNLSQAEAAAAEIMLCRNDLKLPGKHCDQEKAFVIQLDAAASMLKIKMRGLLIIQKIKHP